MFVVTSKLIYLRYGSIQFNYAINVEEIIKNVIQQISYRDTG
jgi:hypothetical protein